MGRIRTRELGAVLFAALGSVPDAANAAPSICDTLEGAVIISHEGKFLGEITNKYDSNSIFNQYGDFGSKYNTDSIFNQFGENGSKFGVNAWSNKFATDPPSIIKDRTVIGVLSVNESLPGAISPVVIGVICYDWKPN